LHRKHAPEDEKKDDDAGRYQAQRGADYILHRTSTEYAAPLGQRAEASGFSRSLFFIQAEQPAVYR